MNSYDLKENGKIHRIGLGFSTPIDGTEPWANNIDSAFDWQFVNGEWSKWRDEIEESAPVYISSQYISSTPGRPNVERKAYIIESHHNWRENNIDIVVGIRHIKDGIKYLDYDTRIVLEVHGRNYQTFIDKQLIDGLNYVQAMRYMIDLADQNGIIDNLIEIY